MTRVWLRSPRFDLTLQVGALASIALPLALYATRGMTRASANLPLAWLFAIPFLHVFGSFFFAFSTERNRSASPPARLAVYWGLWIAASLTLLALAPAVLATFALFYGGWHIFRQNFGFLRELAGRAGLAGDPWLRRLDSAACGAPAVALWLLVLSHGPWNFIGADVVHVPIPTPLVALGFLAVPATALLRWHRARGATAPAALLLLAGNTLALLVPALFLRNLTLVYTLSATYHGVQYLAYLAERERELRPEEEATRVLLPLASAILLSMAAWGAVVFLVTLVAPRFVELALAAAFYAIVPFHYFVDGKIWRKRRGRAGALAAATA